MPNKGSLEIGLLIFTYAFLVLRISVASNEIPLSGDEIYSQLLYPGHREKTPVLLLLIDSLRWDIIDQHRLLTKQDLPGFKLMMELGGHIKRVTPVFPAECYPNLLTLVTGKYPKEHRLLFTTMFDEGTNRSFTYDNRSNHTQNEWVASGELWNPELETSKTFYFHFPLCGSKNPTGLLCEPYAKHHMHPAALNRTLSKALKRLSDGTSDLVVVYYDQLDTVGHNAGPLSKELLLEALPQVDQVVFHLLQQVTAAPRGVHLILTSDHGMAKVRGQELLDRFISRNQVKKVVNRGSTVGIWPDPNHYDCIYRRLDGLRNRHFTVYNRSTIPPSWHTGGPLFPPILLVAKPGYLIHSDHWPMEANRYRPAQPFVGAHGYAATELDMHVPLFVLGPKVRPGVLYTGEALDQVHTYKLLTALSGQTNAPLSMSNSTAYGFSFWSSYRSVSRDAIIETSLGLLSVFFCALILVIVLRKIWRSRMPTYSLVGARRNGDNMDKQLISSDILIEKPTFRSSMTA